MGTGKTASAIWAADFLRKVGLVRTVLVVAPLSCLNLVWAAELFAVAPHASVEVLHYGRDKRKIAARHSRANFLVVNHDGIKVIHHELALRGDLDLVIYDERPHQRLPPMRGRRPGW
jgi:N12 class adenine-specific DNA methylase